MDEKQKIRKLFLSKRKGLNAAKIEEYSIRISENLMKILPKSAKNIMIFQSILGKNEVQTKFIIENLQKNTKIKLFTPKVFDKHTINACLFEKNTEMTLSKWNIPEPSNCSIVEPNKLDVVLVPLLAVTKNGYRIGYGGGFYDKFLKKCNPNCMKIGIGFYPPIADFSWVEKHDIGLDSYINQDEKYSF